MNTRFKYNVNGKYSTKDLKGGYNSNNFSLLNICLDEKGTSVKIQLSNIFKDRYIIAKSKATIAGDEWSLSLALWRKFYNSHGKYNPDLNAMYQCQLNFAIFPAISNISWQHLSYPNLLVWGAFRDFMCIFIYD